MIVVGGNGGSNYRNLATELYTVDSDTWQYVGNYPYASSSLSYMKTIWFSDSFYAFGGSTNYNDAYINRFDPITNNWSRAGSLNHGRYKHNIIEMNNQIYVFGGSGTYNTEKCSFDMNAFTCKSQQPSVPSYHSGLALFIVADNYCES